MEVLRYSRNGREGTFAYIHKCIYLYVHLEIHIHVYVCISKNTHKYICGSSLLMFLGLRLHLDLKLPTNSTWIGKSASSFITSLVACLGAKVKAKTTILDKGQFSLPPFRFANELQLGVCSPDY